jgi:hypothetical protein
MSSKFIAFAVTGSSSGTFIYTIEGALDDLQQTPAANVSWFALSSATTANSSINVFTGPLGGIRVNVAAISSAALTFRALQGIG